MSIRTVSLFLAIALLHPHSWGQSDFVIMDSASYVSVAVDFQGRMQVGGTFLSYPSPVSFVAMYDSTGKPLGKPHDINEYPTNTESPKIAPGRLASAYFWDIFYPGIFRMVRGRLVTLDGDSLTPNVTFSDHGSGSYESCGGASWLSDSSFIVVWSRNDQASSAVYGRIGTLSTPRPVGALLLSDSISHSSNFYHSGRMARHHHTDGFAVIWEEGYPAKRIMLRIFENSGVPIGTTAVVNSDTGSAQVGSASITMSATGEICVVWGAQSLSGTWNIWSRKYTHEGIPLTGPTIITVIPAAAYPHPAVGSNSDGRCIVVWESSDRPYQQLRAQRLNADGSVDGSSMLVAPRADSINQGWPSLAINNGRVFLAWEEGGQIRGKIFSFDDPDVSVQAWGLSSGVTSLSLTNYPNPFNPSTTIRYELPRSSEVRLSVFDILGREVSVLVNERREAGYHEVKFDGSHLSSGVYFYRLRAGDFVQTRKFVLAR